MSKTIKEMTTDEFREMITSVVQEAVDNAMEDIIALNSVEYVNSITEAREEYRKGDVKPLEDVFNK